MNPIRLIQRLDADRDPQRLAIKYRRMRADAFVFLRASCALFYARLPMEPLLRKAPLAWACGDLHLENFGSYKGDNRQIYFDINDFDEALQAPATWDLVRCLASILVGRDSLGLSQRDAALPLQLCEQLLKAYTQALQQGKAGWVERETAQPPVGDLLQAVAGRDRPHFLDSRTTLQGRRRQIRIDGLKALAAPADEQQRVRTLLATLPAPAAQPRFFEVLDVARRIAGTGSLGQARWIVLVRGKGSPDANYLLDLKQAQPASGVARLGLPQPAWPDDAQRIVAAQQRLQAVTMAFLHPVRMGGQAMVLRGLQPAEDRITLARTRHPVRQLQQLVSTLGACLAWAQLRSSGRDSSAGADALIDFGRRERWRQRVLDLARHSADQVEADWAAYAAAYDAGAFDLGVQG